ncbi:hypothetical protein C8J57DRAFT_1512997 [Mycena rebaudengoi]|nr:hypothetical protein C8J57DRAFT_1512997 [Mycena rebaudengoi]
MYFPQHLLSIALLFVPVITSACVIIPPRAEDTPAVSGDGTSNGEALEMLYTCVYDSNYSDKRIYVELWKALTDKFAEGADVGVKEMRDLSKTRCSPPVGERSFAEA